MACSILLLLLFQAYWLRKTYRDEFFSLRRELGLVLRETTVRRQMVQLMNIPANRVDTVRMTTTVVSGHKQDSSQMRNGMRWEMSVNVTGDSTSGRRSPRMMTFDPDRRNDHPESLKKIVIMTPFFGDSPSLATVDSLYQKALAENEIKLGYALRRLSKSQLDSLQANEPVRMNMILRRGTPTINMEIVEATFENPFLVLIPKMWGPIFFSILMLGITLAAFLFLYRSLKAQHRLALLKTDFISNITHELKTPIATVGVAIEALKNFNAMNDPQRTREYLDISGNELHRLSLLVDKVLRLSMFEQDKMELRKEPQDIQALVNEVLQSMKLQFEKAGADIQVAGSSEQFVVNGDKLHLLSVLYNLIDNALKYSEGKPAIKIALQEDGKWLRISVQDNGMGIPAEYKQKVFDKFFRVPHGDTHNIKGYGLGLSYVAEVVKKHGGSIEVQAAPVKGSTFIVTLPLADVSA